MASASSLRLDPFLLQTVAISLMSWLAFFPERCARGTGDSHQRRLVRFGVRKPYFGRVHNVPVNNEGLMKANRK